MFDVYIRITATISLRLLNRYYIVLLLYNIEFERKNVSEFLLNIRSEKN